MHMKKYILQETSQGVKVARWMENKKEVFFVLIPRKAWNTLVPAAYIYVAGAFIPLRTFRYVGSPLRILVYTDGKTWYYPHKDTLYITERIEDLVRILHPDSYDWVKECDPIALFTELTY